MNSKQIQRNVAHGQGQPEFVLTSAWMELCGRSRSPVVSTLEDNENEFALGRRRMPFLLALRHVMSD